MSPGPPACRKSRMLGAVADAVRSRESAAAAVSKTSQGRRIQLQRVGRTESIGRFQSAEGASKSGSPAGRLILTIILAELVVGRISLARRGLQVEQFSRVTEFIRLKRTLAFWISWKRANRPASVAGLAASREVNRMVAARDQCRRWFWHGRMV
jgi:hypothetical protein